MSSLERLPADQRAVLALVLQRGRSYDEIAELLAIDRAAVRDRALAALDALGPSGSKVAPERRALITDYLLGQLPPRVHDDVRARLATSPSERAWARVLAGELAPLATKPLPEIPSAQPGSAPAATTQAPAAAPASGPAAQAPVTPVPEAPITPVPEPAATPDSGAPAAPTQAPAAAPTQAPAAAAAETTSQASGQRVPPPTPTGRSSDRRGGGIFLALALVVVIAVVIIIVATSGSSSPKKSTTTKAGTTPTTTPSTTTTTTTSGVTPHIVAKIVLRPTSRSSKALGAADVVTEGKVTGVIVRAIHLTPNTTHNAYAVWLATPGGASHLLGYVSPAVGKSGALSTSGPLPSNVASYKELLITLETTANTKTPGPPVLAGALSLG